MCFERCSIILQHSCLIRSVLLHVALSDVLFKFLVFCMFLAHGVSMVRTFGKCFITVLRTGNKF